MDVPSIAKRIQIEETQTNAPVSESTVQKMGGTMNFLLDHYAIPPGSMMSYSGLEGSVPSGWFICDGRAVDRTTYANLFAAIGTLYGVGNGSTTFNVPDFRGMFLRMVDKSSLGNAGRDPDHAARAPAGTGGTEDPGSTQGSQNAVHDHLMGYQTAVGAGGDAGSRIAPSTGSTVFSQAQGGNEARPINAYVFWIVKW